MLLLGSILLDGVGCVANAPDPLGMGDDGAAQAAGESSPERTGEAAQDFAFLPAIIAALITAGVGGAVAYGIAYRGWQQQGNAVPPLCPSYPPPMPSNPPPAPDPTGPGWMSLPL